MLPEQIPNSNNLQFSPKNFTQVVINTKEGFISPVLLKLLKYCFHHHVCIIKAHSIALFRLSGKFRPFKTPTEKRIFDILVFFSITGNWIYMIQIVSATCQCQAPYDQPPEP